MIERGEGVGIAEGGGFGVCDRRVLRQVGEKERVGGFGRPCRRGLESLTSMIVIPCL